MRGGQASVNPKADTVEELQGRRKALHLGMHKLAQQDLALALQAEQAAYEVPRPPPFLSPSSYSEAMRTRHATWMERGTFSARLEKFRRQGLACKFEAFEAITGFGER